MYYYTYIGTEYNLKDCVMIILSSLFPLPLMSMMFRLPGED